MRRTTIKEPSKRRSRQWVVVKFPHSGRELQPLNGLPRRLHRRALPAAISARRPRQKNRSAPPRLLCSRVPPRTSGGGCFNQVGGAPTGASPTLPLLGRPLWSPRFCRLAEAIRSSADGCAVSSIRSLNSHPGLSARCPSCTEVDVERHGPRLARKPSSPLRHQLYTMTAIKIVPIHFEPNVRIRIGLERTSRRRYYGSANSAHRTKRG